MTPAEKLLEQEKLADAIKTNIDKALSANDLATADYLTRVGEARK